MNDVKHPSISLVLRLDPLSGSGHAATHLREVERKAAREYAHLILENPKLRCYHNSANLLLEYLDHNHLSLGPGPLFSAESPAAW